MKTILVFAALVFVNLWSVDFDKIIPPDSDSEIVIAGPLKVDLDSKAQEIATLFHKGFKWEDLVIMIDSSRQYLKTHHSLTPDVEKEAVKYVVGEVLLTIDALLFPVTYSKALFKYVMGVILDTLYPKKGFGFQINTTDIPDTELAKTLAESLLKEYQSHFAWSDLGNLLGYAIAAADSFSKADFEDKCNCAKTIMNTVIDETDSGKLPELFVDWIFKKIGAGIIDVHFGNEVLIGK